MDTNAETLSRNPIIKKFPDGIEEKNRLLGYCYNVRIEVHNLFKSPELILHWILFYAILIHDLKTKQNHIVLLVTWALLINAAS